MEETRAPLYVDSFICIGSECPRTCCARWTIPVDEHKKQDYDKCPDAEMKKKLDEYIVPFKSGMRAYRIQFTDEGYCPFLNEAMLCEMQLRLGVKSLPAACAYPRRGFLINGSPELSMVLSCPVTAGLALWIDGRMRFDDAPRELPPHFTEIELNSSYAAFSAARDFLIDIVQYQKLPFEARLVLLGIFIEHEWEGDFVNVVEKCENFRRYMDRESKNVAFSHLSADYPMQFNLISKLLEGMANRAPMAEYGSLLAKCGEGLNKVQEFLIAEGSKDDAYAVVTRNFKDYCDSAGIVFENYFSNEIFRETLACAGFKDNMFEAPVEDKNALKKAYMLWCASYRMLHFQFACLYALQGELKRTDTVDVVTLYCRAAFTHNVEFADEFCEWMESQGLNNVSSLARLVTS